MRITTGLQNRLAAVVFTGILTNAFPFHAVGQTAAELRTPAPELEERSADEWINSQPLKLADLKGQVVVVHFWTFGCINCIHNQPHYKSWHRKYSEKGLTIIGVHTPETEGERDIDAVRQSTKDKGLEYPIVMDQDAAIWKTWGTQWWPTTYLIDKQGNVRYRWDGELNWKKNKGEVLLRRKIEALLKEPGPKIEKSKPSSAGTKEEQEEKTSNQTNNPNNEAFSRLCVETHRSNSRHQPGRLPAQRASSQHSHAEAPGVCCTFIRVIRLIRGSLFRRSNWAAPLFDRRRRA